ncbi:MAG: metallophosphoesterase [Bilifractor sp.]
MTQTVAAALAVLIAGTSFPVYAGTAKENQQLKIGVLSDTHYMSPTMIADTEDYQEHLNSDRKMFSESDAFLNALLGKIGEDRPDVLLISGDLTKDGEKENHEALAGKLEQFEKKYGTKVYITPGNHDLNNSNGMNFNTADGIAVPAGRTSQSDYVSIYSDLVYNDPEVTRYQPKSGQAGGLSYVARPKNGFTIISIDSARYSADNTESGKDEHETSGTISADLEQWVVEQTKAAKERGDTVIGLEHHGMVPHFSEEQEVLPMYLVQDYDRLSKEFADAGMSYIFTGHMHANDIAQVTSDSGSTMTDIETGSVLTYPSPARSVTLDRSIENGTVNETMQVKSYLHVSAGTFTNPQTKQQQTVSDISAYGKEHGFTNEMLTQSAGNLLLEELDQYGSSEQAVLSLISTLLYDGNQVTLDQVISDLIEKNIPLQEDSTVSAAAANASESDGTAAAANGQTLELTDEDLAAISDRLEEAIQEKGTVTEDDVLAVIESYLNETYPEMSGNSAAPNMLRAAAADTEQNPAYYRDAQNNIYITYSKKIIFSTIKIGVKITPEGIRQAAEQVFAKLDSMAKDDATRQELIGALVQKLTGIEVAKDGDTAKTLLDYVNYTYQRHLGGEDSEAIPQWVQDTRTMLGDGTLTDQVIDAAIEGGAGIIDRLLNTLTVKELTGIAAFTKDGSGVTPVEGRTPLFEVTEGQSKIGGWLPILNNDMVDKDGSLKEDYTVRQLIDWAAKFLKKDVNIEQSLKNLIDGTEATDTEPATEGILKADQRQKLTDFACRVVDSLTTDVNYKEDNNTTLTYQWKLQTDRTALDAAIRKAKQYNPDDYTYKTARELENALSEAEALSLTASQEEIDKAAKALEDAMNALVKRSDSGNTDTGNPDTEKTVVMYRIYNPNSGEHFYTKNPNERKHLISLGWNDEGIGWIAPAHSGKPVYRLYNPYGGEHHYTMSSEEKNLLVKAGWNDEGIGWYSDEKERTPIYREYNPNAFANNHNYTASKKENDYLISLGWRYENIGWYGVSAA